MIRRKFLKLFGVSAAVSPFAVSTLAYANEPPVYDADNSFDLEDSFDIQVERALMQIRNAGGRGDYQKVIDVWNEFSMRSTKHALALHRKEGVPFLIVSAVNWKTIKEKESV